MRVVDYDTKETASVENHLSVDAQMEAVIDHPGGIQDHALVEGFEAMEGIHTESAETGGQLDHDEIFDELVPDLEPISIVDENLSLAS